jgi:hypothetical protein
MPTIKLKDVCYGFITSFLLMLLQPVHAQHTGTPTQTLSDTTGIVKDTARAEKKDLSEKSKGLFVLPLLYYTPDTRLAFGAFGVYYFKLKNQESNTATRLSYAKLLADYTLNKQLDIWGSWSVFLKDESYILKGELRYRNFPDKFYGIGNKTLEVNLEKYEYDLYSFKALALKKIAPHMFFGGDYQLSYFYDLKLTPDKQLATGEITGSNGGLNSGVGLVYMIDTRDNVINASKGLFLEASSYFYGRATGSSFTFNNYSLVVNKYFRVLKNHVIATNTVFNLNTGDPPFVNLATVGGDDILRGYAKNRYKDMNFIGTQVEYRMPLFWRIGVVGFTGIGDVFNQPSDVSLSTLKYSYGAGIRYSINEKEKLNIRFDYGFGRKSQSFYLMITEAF